MKKILLTIISLILIMGLVTGCATDKATETGGTEDLRVILLIPGTLGDKSFFDSANAGLGLIEDEFGATTKVIEMGTDNTKFTAVLEDVIDEGWDVIITGGINISQPLQEVAAEYPEQRFILFDETVEFSDGQNANIHCMTYRGYEGGYLAGSLASLVSASNDMPKSNDKNTIGFAGGFDIPLINDWLVGYIQGATAVNPDVKVGIGYMNSFTDAAKGKEIGIALYNAGADVVLQAAGGAGLGVLDAAKEKGAYAIGTDSDQAELFSSDKDKANSILSSVMKRVDISIRMAIEEYIDGTIEFGNFKSYGVSEGCIELADNDWYQENVTSDIREKMVEITDKLESGDIKVDSAFDLTDDELTELKNKVMP